MIFKKLQSKKNAFTLTELLISVLIFIFLMSGIGAAVFTGSQAWSGVEDRIRIQEKARHALNKISIELANSGSSNTGATLQFTVSDGGGINNPGNLPNEGDAVVQTDIVQFTIPILCETTTEIMTSDGDVAHWGSPLTWGCVGDECSDYDNDCSTEDDGRQIQYLLVGSATTSSQLVRRVLDVSGNVVAGSENIIASHIVDLQAVVSGDNDLLTLTLTASNNDKGSNERGVTVTVNGNIFFRNRG